MEIDFFFFYTIIFSKILAFSGYSEIRVLNKVHVCMYVLLLLRANCKQANLGVFEANLSGIEANRSAI